MKRSRSKLTYANVMSTIAVFLVVAGGTAYAATEMLPKNSVGSKQIVRGAVTPAKLSKTAKATLTGPRGATGATGPSGPQGSKGDKGDPGPIGPSEVFSAVHSGGLPVKAVSEFGDETFLSLESLPAGSYLIQATLEAENLSESTFLSCVLAAGEASSEQLISVGSGVGHMEEAPMSLQLTHRLTSTGSAELACGISSGSHTVIRNIAITAIRVGNLTESKE